ncbi:hypothetical protein BROUX41_004796 [Berkeleyomyces rouxiae]|uniref:uncharacterized protein n=1 Tax=Berkeleyomyces rouxiae TaxID=2035830 RepID=UPI003B7A2AA0
MVSFKAVFIAALAALEGVNAGPIDYRQWPRFTVPQVHFEILSLRQSTSLNRKALVSAKCLDPNAHIVFHDENAAEMSICDGFNGGHKCDGTVALTTGHVLSARFSIEAQTPGSTITISRMGWEQCVRAAREVCPTGSLTAVCYGGASKGDIAFRLETP